MTAKPQGQWDVPLNQIFLDDRAQLWEDMGLGSGGRGGLCRQALT